MKAGVRNQIEAEVVDIKKGEVMSQVKVKLKNTSAVPMSSVMTVESLDEMNLKKGDTVRVLVKAVNVTLIKE